MSRPAAHSTRHQVGCDKVRHGVARKHACSGPVPCAAALAVYNIPKRKGKARKTHSEAQKARGNGRVQQHPSRGCVGVGVPLGGWLLPSGRRCRLRHHRAFPHTRQWLHAQRTATPALRGDGGAAWGRTKTEQTHPSRAGGCGFGVCRGGVWSLRRVPTHRHGTAPHKFDDVRGNNAKGVASAHAAAKTWAHDGALREVCCSTFYCQACAGAATAAVLVANAGKAAPQAPAAADAAIPLKSHGPHTH